MPKKTNTPPKADHSKHCRYHRNRDHSIEERSALKDKIEELIKLDHLKDFSIGHSHTSPREEIDPNLVEEETKSMSDGQEGKGAEADLGREKREPLTNRGSVISVNMISQHQVPNMLPITFTTKDFKAIDPVKDDPMVISVEIANSIVKKTLVD
ncbi:hypothetical protein AAZX31_04G156900 [Glycine max]|nr:hypothetical protein JHK85_010818 [Glycine max]KAG5066796.1 hypothetical protein JHK86_010527 [Glycine max]